MNYIIFDLEATCGEGVEQSEIIEIGAVKLNDKLEVVDEFQSFVRPIIHPTLTYFCEELTSITQADVDNAENFDLVFLKFYDWATDVSTSPTKFCSWGFYDKKMLLSDFAQWKHMTEIFAKAISDNHISIKHQHGEFLYANEVNRPALNGMIPTSRTKQLKRGVGMEKALDILGLKLEGTHHRGIDDARNIAKIFTAIFPILKFD